MIFRAPKVSTHFDVIENEQLTILPRFARCETDDAKLGFSLANLNKKA